ncbi:hypothetical protein STEG23_031797, partial [Scotinomys teguina]
SQQGKLNPEYTPPRPWDPGTVYHSVDEYGWIAAAVGWSLWFLTLILLCVDKLMKLTPEEPKDLAA